MGLRPVRLHYLIVPIAVHSGRKEGVPAGPGTKVEGTKVNENKKTWPGKKTSVKIEFAIWVILLLFATSGTLAWFMLRSEKEALTREVTRRGVALTQYLATHSIDPFLTDDKLTLATLVADVMKNEDVVYALIADRDGRVIAADRSELIGNPYRRPPGTYPLDRPEARTYTWHHDAAGWVIDIGIPLILEERTKIGEIHLGMSRATINKVVQAAWQKAMGLSGFFILAGLIGSIVLVTTMLRPVSELTKGAKAIGCGDFDYQIPRMRQNELGQLAETFNHMTRELKTATEQALEQERIKKELQVAQQIQQMLLPKHLPEIKGFSFGSLYRAAKEVGGDYYDFFQVGSNRLGVTVADVCGKGVPAGLLMSVARSILKSLAPNQQSPVSVVRELNRVLLSDFSRGLFITMFYAVIDIPRRTILYTSAGHNPGLIYRTGSGEYLPLALDPPCLPLGVDGSGVFEHLAQEKKVSLQKGDVLVLYTDGVTEAMNEEREEFGVERLQKTIKQYAHNGRNNAEGIIHGLDLEISRFCGDLHQNDDIAVVTMKVE
ncbi:SpoIIE family protein phosphatase [candidate division FCPU426 bacterium]|nr:SpoIIE family protein phosphatase [candidate division FCPU426 bacterium]